MLEKADRQQLVEQEDKVQQVGTKTNQVEGLRQKEEDARPQERLVMIDVNVERYEKLVLGILRGVKRYNDGMMQSYLDLDYRH